MAERVPRIAEVPYAVDDAVDLAHLFALELQLVDPSQPALDCPGYRLPTDFEWEVAAWAGQLKAEPFDVASVAWNDQNSGKSVHPVGLKRPNPWGFRDLLGNVSEWTGDYSTGLVIDPAQGSNRLIRAGAWLSPELIVRAAYSFEGGPSARNDALGFRFARGQGLR